MNKFEENVNGTVIGSFYIQSFLTYCGRKQGNTIYSLSKEDAIKKATELKEDIIKVVVKQLI